MKRFILAGLLALSACESGYTSGQSAQQALVDRATIAFQEMMSGGNADNRAELMQHARAVMICPRVFKAGFIFGGSGGDCVLLARDGRGSWSAPAFYAMGSGSFGLQAGIQDSELIMMILTRRGLDAIMDSQFKFGANASIAVATLGAGVEGDTTAALRADVVAYSAARGLFAGVALDGSILTSDTAWNQAYYGSPLAARQIVVQMQVNNAGANPLRAMLGRYGAPAGASAYGTRYAAPAPGYEDRPDTEPYTPDNRGAVSQQSLPPPR